MLGGPSRVSSGLIFNIARKMNDYDLSINRYKEIVYEPIEYDPPLEIIKKMKEMESGILKDLEELEAMLKK